MEKERTATMAMSFCTSLTRIGIVLPRRSLCKLIGSAVSYADASKSYHFGYFEKKALHGDQDDNKYMENKAITRRALTMERPRVCKITESKNKSSTSWNSEQEIFTLADRHRNHPSNHPSQVDL